MKLSFIMTPYHSPLLRHYLCGMMLVSCGFLFPSLRVYSNARLSVRLYCTLIHNDNVNMLMFNMFNFYHVDHISVVC